MEKNLDNVFRPLADFPENIWEDPLTSFSISDSTNETYKEKRSSLKDQVKELFMASKANPIENIKFIDLLCRLGVSYHFEKDIEDQLEKILHGDDLHVMMRSDEFDLCTAGVVFQVFRQFGYKVSTEVFDKFKNKDGKFKEQLGEDARAMLSLYEAAQWITHGEEDTLDEALSFSSSRLEGLACRCSPNLALRIKNALKHSYHKGIPRIEMRQYISYYEEEASHDKTLLEFSKIDFNFLQQLHREELADLYRWYKDLELEARFPYARSRTVECYLWALGAYFEPQYSRARFILAAILIILTILDDTYDAYGTLEELDRFTDAVNKWDLTAAKGLPESLKYLYHVIFYFYEKLEEQMKSEGRPGCGFYARKSVIQLARCYHQEAKWLNEDYMATFEEYKENGVFSCGYYTAVAASFVGMSDVAKLDAFEWLSSNPKILVASEIITRFMDDITTHEFEHKRKHVGTAIDCYTKQYGVSNEKAIEEIKSIISDSWKDLNQELMRPDPSIPFPLLIRILNLTRVIEVFYKYQDSFTNPEFLRDDVISLLINKIPI